HWDAVPQISRRKMPQTDIPQQRLHQQEYTGVKPWRAMHIPRQWQQWKAGTNNESPVTDLQESPGWVQQELIYGISPPIHPASASAIPAPSAPHPAGQTPH